MNNEHDIFNTLKQVRMTENERELLESRLTEYRALKPLPPAPVRVASPLSFLTFARPMPVFASLAILLLVGGSVAQAAEGAVPGDLLYPVKTAVTEPVREALAVDSEAKVAVEVWKAERRLEEAQTLAVRAAMTEETTERLEEHFSKHAARVEERLATISDRDPALAADLAVKFEASLAAHDAILASLDTPKEKKLRATVKKKLGTIGQVRRLAAAQAVDEGGAEGAAAPSAKASATLMVAEDTARVAPAAAPVPHAPSAALTKTVTRARESASRALIDAEQAFEDKQLRLSSEAQAAGAARLVEARQTYERAEAAFLNGSLTEAYTAYQHVLLSGKILTVLLKTDSRVSLPVPVIEVDPVDPLPPLPQLDDSYDDANEVEYEVELDIRFDDDTIPGL